MMASVRRAVAFGLLLTGPAPVAAAETDFVRDVWPILESRCVECHGPPRQDSKGRLRGPKGGLRLDGRDYILAGSETSTRIVVPGQPEESLLFKLTSLPADDLDIMPSKGDRLRDSEIETIRAWISQGADYGDWIGTGGPPTPPARKTAHANPLEGPPSRTLHIWRQLGQGLSPAAAREGLCGGLATTVPLFPGSPLLRVSFTSHQKELLDSQLEDLAPLAGHIAILDLGRTSVTDAGLASIGDLPRLVTLNLRGTKVTDKGLTRLRTSPELRSLVLLDTGITDASVATLIGLTKLEHLYLWGTQVSATGAQQIREARPGLRLRGEPDLPPAVPRAAARRRRRN